MQIASRRKAVLIFSVLSACAIGLALALNTIWVIRWREVGVAALGVIFFAFIIFVLTMNSVFLVREIRRNEQHDSFINAVTHELKTPIASIRLYLETLQSREIDAEQRARFYRIMLEDSDRLLGTVEQVLKAGALAQNRGRQGFAPLDLALLVGECVALARTRRHLPDEAILFRNYAEGASRMIGDAEDLRTAVLNLVDNAVKYSPDEVRVELALVCEGASLMLRVSDRGVGLQRGELKRIFRRFYRAPQRLRAKGTGLGLFIVRQIARRHGGDVWAESAGRGCGSTFTLRLPGGAQ